MPNTIDMALQPSREARAIIKADPPFALMHVNDPWTTLSGVTHTDAEGTPLCDALRLHPSQEEQLYSLAADCSIGRASSAILMTRSLVDPAHPALIYLKVRYDTCHRCHLLHSVLRPSATRTSSSAPFVIIA